MAPNRPLPTWEEPRRDVVRRWRQGGVTFAELSCEHVIPATGLDVYKALRCSECNPVKRVTFEPVPEWRD